MPLTRRTFLAGLSASAALLSTRPLWAATAAEPKSRRKLGVALAGLGYYAAQELAPALLETQNCQLTGVVTGSPEKGARWSKSYHFPTTSIYSFDEMDRLADNKEIDIVYVVTPPGLHVEHVLRAAKAGKHVICEKPMANTAAECATMIEACRQAGVQLSVGYRLHYDPYHQELMKHAQAQTFGRFNRIEGGHAFRIQGNVWRVNKRLAGGGPLMDVGIYFVQGACMAANADPIAVTAKERPKTRPDYFSEVEEALDFTLYFADGSTAQGFTSYNESSNFLRAEGDKGFFELKPAFSYRGISAQTSRGKLSFPVVRQQALHMDAIAAAIRDGQPVPTNGEMGRRDMRIIDAIYAAAASGEKVPVAS